MAGLTQYTGTLPNTFFRNPRLSYDSHGHGRNRRSGFFRACASRVENPYSVLEVSRSSSREEIRQAYLEKMKVLHPDVSVGDTTMEASRVNVAYQALLESFDTGVRIPTFDDEDEKDVFDRPEGPPVNVFVNPFACPTISPMQWRELQDVVQGANDPEEALFLAGVSFGSDAICSLSNAQLEGVTEELEKMEVSMDVEMCRWMLTDFLVRASWANRRAPSAF